MKRQLSLLLTGLLMTGCQVASPTGAGTVTATARLQVADATGRRVMATVTPWKTTDIHHVKLTLESGGATVTTVPVAADKLTSTVQFSNLRHSTSYVVTAQAFQDAAETIEIDDFQLNPDSCKTFFSTTTAPVADVGMIQLKLANASFNGTASPTLAITPGLLGNTAAGLGFGMARTVGTVAAGNGTAPNAAGFQNTLATSAQLTYNEVVAADAAGNVYLLSQNDSLLRKISPDGVMTTLVGGNGTTVFGSGTNDGDGPSGVGRLYVPFSLAVTPDGTIFVGDHTNRIRQVSPSGVVSTYAGTGGYGAGNGAATGATFRYPRALAVDATGNLYVFDSDSRLVRRIDAVTKVVTTIAGTESQDGHVDGPGATAKFNNVTSMTLDTEGHLFLAEPDTNRIRQIDLNADGYPVTTIMGTQPGSNAEGGYANGPAGDSARTNYLRGIVAANGKLYIADTYNCAVRQLDLADPTYPVTTVAGGNDTNMNGWSYLNGPGANAGFTYVYSVAYSAVRGLVVTDYYNHTIRQIDLNSAERLVSTIAGGTEAATNGYGYSDGSGATAQFSSPAGLSADAAGNTYVADPGTHTIRKVAAGGQVSVMAGGTAQVAGGAGYADGPGASSRFTAPAATVIDMRGNVYVADTGNHAIRKITPAGVVSTIAGGDGATANGAGYTDGAGASARFSSPRGLALSNTGTLYVSDAGNNCLRAIDLNDANFAVTTLAGAGMGQLNGTGYTNGSGPTAQFANPGGIALDTAGNLYVADAGNNAIRKVTKTGVVSTLAGGTAGTANAAGFLDVPDGSGANVRFSAPSALTVDGFGNVYVADTGNNAIRRVAASGATMTLAGSGTATGGYANLMGKAGLFNGPMGITLNASGKLIVSDTLNHCIRQL